MMVDNHHNNVTLNTQLFSPPSKKKKRKKMDIPNVFKFGTLNINNLLEYKKNILYEMIEDNKIQILGLSETHITKKQAKYIFKEFKNEYTFYHDIDETNIKSTGVGILIRNDFDLKVIKVDSYRGRIIYLDLQMENKKKIRIIQFYGISKPTKTAYTQGELKNLHKKLLSIIGEGKAHQFEIILMGDFNLRYESYEKQLKYKKKKISVYFKIFKKLEEKYLLGDMFKEFNQISIDNPLNTYFSWDGKKQSRIDYIWCTEEFFDKVLNTYIYDVKELINTDHRLLIFSMEGYNFLERKLGNSDNYTLTKKILYNYDDLNDERKEKFKEILNNKLQQDEEKLLSDNIDENWTIIKTHLQDTADEIISKKEISLEKRTYNPV
jgi:exonuclease III